VSTITEAAPDQEPLLQRLVDWATALETEELIKLWTVQGKSGRFTLLPYIPEESAGLVTIWNDKGPTLSF
jgi:hypothetical protein